MKRLRLGVIGVGALGQHHARVYAGLRDATLIGIVDTDPKRAHEIATRHGCLAFQDFRQCFGRMDAVSIAVPTSLHYAIARDCLEHGLHVLVEKPITVTAREADDLVKRAAESNLILQVGHIERFNSAWRASLGALKAPRVIECRRWAPFTVRGADVDVVLDLMIHDLDIVLGLIPSEVRRVEASGVCLVSPTTDVAQARVVFENEAVASFSASRVAEAKVRELRLYEPEGSLVVDFVGQVAQIGRRTMTAAGRSELRTEVVHGDGQEPLKLELEAFVEAVRSGNAPQASGQEGAAALRLAESIRKAIARKTAR